ncbi:hypothetical protein CANINC_004293 [Pichia inconspicua]|uniref:DUF7907 domain-containing protein n=1 Tax=Pichia inconspicua TaxID=52247 RepID=A0A4T0WWC8_9ASCO|nr:hypothetical protein CANINC_004293 [[Candida] inconspicua]
MLSKTALLLAASATFATASTEDVILTVKSDNQEVNGNNLSFLHEGAGINYAFLGTGSNPEPLEYDSEAKTLTQDIEIAGGQHIPLVFGEYNSYVAVSVSNSLWEITFDKDDTLAVNGTTSGFYACKNTNDPYNYSKMSYELMYYTENAPEACIDVTLVKQSGPAPAPSSSAPSISSTSSNFDGAAGHYAPAGAFAVVAGVAAALI